MKIKTKNKRKIYILSSVFLGILLGTIAHATLERAYISEMLSKGIVPEGSWSGNCFLPSFLSSILFLGGASLGYVLGVRWWQIVYVERRHWRFGKK